MTTEQDSSLEPTAEQVRYSTVLRAGMLSGLACLLTTFAIYLSGTVEPHIPPEELAKHWNKDVCTYLADTRIDVGWSWVEMVGYGDFLNFVGIAILAGTTIPCYIAIVPLLLSKKDYVYATIASVEVIVLLVAASGIIAVGH